MRKNLKLVVFLLLVAVLVYIWTAFAGTVSLEADLQKLYELACRAVQTLQQYQTAIVAYLQEEFPQRIREMVALK